MRLPGWELRLFDAIERAASTPFEWGQHDCVTWAMDVRREITGEEIAVAPWRGTYKTAAGARKALRKAGWPDIEAAAHDLLGPPLSTPLLAQRGDLLLTGEDPAIGVCVGSVGAFLSPEGLTPIPIADCRLAWRV